MASTPDKPKKKVTASAARAGATVKRVTRKRAAKTAVAATHEDIARRAYELFETGAGGDALEHWLQAERELIAA